jgi:cytochrome c553
MTLPSPYAAALAALLSAAAAPAALGADTQPPPFAAGDAAAGKAMVDADCVACHEQRFGTAGKVYLRADRRVHTPAQLLAQIQRCDANLGLSHFPEEEEHIAAYLNLHYYRFKP